MKIRSIKFVQNGQIIYSTTIEASKLVAITKIDVWNPEINENDPNELERQGYQRSPIKSHYTKVGKYLANYRDAILPTSILLNSRKNLKFIPDEDSNLIQSNGISGILEIPENTQLYIVDGQHRIWGIKYAIEELGLENIKSFPLPVIILNQGKKEEEIRHFYIVNSTQKKVRTDLAERLLKLLAMKDPRVKKEIQAKGIDWKLIAVNIADKLSRDPDSVWYKRIKPPNSPSMPDAVASQGSFTQSLKSVLMSDFAQNESEERIINQLKVYWNAIRDLLPEAFEEPKKYVIQKTPGMYALHMVFPYVIYECTKEGDYSKEKIKEILQCDPEHFSEPEFWESGGDGAALYNSLGAFRLLSKDIIRNLKGE